MKEFDAIVIGAGSGLDIASAFASNGYDVAVVEPGPMGGTCLNRGCIPSKMLIHHADVASTIRESENFYIDASIESIDFETIVNEVNHEVSSDSENIEKAIGNSENHTLYKTEAEFVDEKTLEVDGEKITADKIFIAAGTRPMVPPIDGLDEVDYLTSKEALQLDEKPEDLVIIGGGYIACEMAHFFHQMDVDVTIIERGTSLVKREDADVSAKYTQLAERKYNLELEKSVTEVEEAGGKVRVKAEDEDGNIQSYAGEEVLVATGRVPNTDRLKVEDAGIETDERGFVETDEKMRTNVDGVWAIGDIAGNWMFKHSANHEAEVALRNAFGHDMEVDYSAMPHAIFSNPQIAGVGKTEQELREEGQDYEVGKYNYEDTGMGLALKEKDGFVKVLASPRGEILGVHIIGPEASSIIHEAIVAMRHNMTVDEMQDTIHIHPALSEVVQRAFNQL